MTGADMALIVGAVMLMLGSMAALDRAYDRWRRR